MHRSIAKKIFLLAAGCLFLLPSAASAAKGFPKYTFPGYNFVIPAFLKDLGVADSLSGQPCTQGSDQCPGWCHCDLSAVEVKRSFDFFDFQSPIALFGITPTEAIATQNNQGDFGGIAGFSYTIPYSVNFVFSPQKCDIEYQSLQPSAQLKNGDSWSGQDFYASDQERQNAIVKSCKFEAAFCCCEVDSSGHKSNCSRSVDFDLKTSKKQCAVGKKDFPDTGAGCTALNYQQDQTKNPDFSNQRLTAAIEQIKNNAKDLNKTNFTSIPQIIGQIINFFVVIIGMISLFLYVYAGFLWMTGGGNAERIAQAKNIFLWTTIGLIAMMGTSIGVKTIINFATGTAVV